MGGPQSQNQTTKPKHDDEKERHYERNDQMRDSVASKECLAKPMPCEVSEGPGYMITKAYCGMFTYKQPINCPETFSPCRTDSHQPGQNCSTRFVTH